MRSFLLVILTVLATQACSESDAVLKEAIDAVDANVVFMRHAVAPGFGDPDNFSLSDCSTQRNLDTRGRKQARAIGASIQKSGIRFDQILSSEWCRCKETAEKLGFGLPVQEASLNSFFDDMRQGPQSNVRLQKFIANQLKTKQDKALILVTHHVNIAEFMGQNIGSGDMVLVKVDANGKALSSKVYPSP